MKIPKTIDIIECRKCNGSYFGGKTRVSLMPGDETQLPDELCIIVRRLAKCQSCKERENRTPGGRKQKFER